MLVPVNTLTISQYQLALDSALLSAMLLGFKVSMLETVVTGLSPVTSILLSGLIII
jgi:hypothetical protein